MAGSPQHLIKIMATQTRFDLNAAIENWRNELSAQSQLTPDNRRELEKHLADAMAELRQRGLNEEEAFWLARRRIGQPQQLAEEFQKADPTKVWRERAFWMELAILFFLLWQRMVGSIAFHDEWFSFHYQSFIYLFLISLMPIGLAILLAKGKLNYPLLGRAFKNRWLFASSIIVILLLTDVLQTWGTGMSWLNQIRSFSFPLMLIAVAAWLMPKQERQKAA